MAARRALLALGLLAALPAPAQEDSALLAPVAWLAGCWAAEGREPGSGEHWLAPAGQTMLGISRTVRQGRTIEFEFMQLRADAQGGLVFVAMPSGQRETAFALAASAPGSATFENPRHDFPQRVIYRLLPGERLLARIEGLRGGTLRGMDFPMRRVDCNPPLAPAR